MDFAKSRYAGRYRKIGRFKAKKFDISLMLQRRVKSSFFAMGNDFLYRSIQVVGYSFKRKGGCAMGKKELLIRMIGLSGEMPADMAVKLLGSVTYTASVVSALKNQGYIAVRSRDGIKGYVLRSKGKKALMQCDPKIFEPYLSGSAETNHLRSEPHRRLRLHRMSMVWVFLFQIGIEIFILDKPAYPPPVEKLRAKPVYYGAAEFKKAVDQTRGSRACGVLCAEKAVFVVYHTMDRLMKWSKKTERAMRGYVECSPICSGDIFRADAIMIGNTMDMLLLLLESNGGLKGNLFQIDDTYEHYYFTPMYEDCRVQMKLITDSKAEILMRKLLGNMLVLSETKEYALADGFDQTGRSVYFLYKLDLLRLIRIKQETIWGRTGVAYCFDYQADILQEFFGEEMELHPVIGAKVLEYLCGCEASEA